jgi:protein ImuB
LRFGGEVLLRLDQAMGSAAEVLTSLVPPEVPRSELRFAEPLSDPEDLKRVIERLCEELCRDLETRGVGARRLDLVFLRVDNLAQAVRIGLSRPYREPKHLAKLLAERLVLVDPGFGIETASLTGSWVEAVTERQTVGRHVGADGADVDADVDVSQLVDTLGVRLTRRSVVSGTGHAGRHGRRRLLSDGSRPAPPRHGDVQIHRWRQRIPGQADHRHAG